jgi:gamma-aminobutyric acid type B receptor
LIYDEDEAKGIVEEEDSLNERCIGEYSGVTRTLHLEKCENIKWVKNRPPKDRTFSRIEQTRVPLTLYIGIVVVASIGILLATVFLGINIRFRNNRYICKSALIIIIRVVT